MQLCLKIPWVVFSWVVCELLKAEQIFAMLRGSELIMTYLTKNQFSFTGTLVRKSETRMFPCHWKRMLTWNQCWNTSGNQLSRLQIHIAADGDVCLFGSLKPFPCSCLVGESIGCRMQGGLGVIQHGFRVLFVVVFGFVLVFILKSSVEILNALLPFHSSLYSFTFSPPALVSEGPLFPCCWGSRLGLQRVGSAVWSFQRLCSSMWLLGWFVTRYFFGVFVCPVVC